MQPAIERIEDAFLSAMAEGWTSNAAEAAGADFPELKKIPFLHGEFRVVDGYLAPPNAAGYSAGWTVIYYLGKPVWQMHYQGRYAKNAIPYLKQCLHQAYVINRRFYGGRGPAFVRGERFTYINAIESPDFEKFSGLETIYDENAQWLGYHEYRGLLLFPTTDI